jgi:DNA-binding response OmpR family regulator
MQWLERADQPDDQCLSPTTVLVVDDDAVSNRALIFALSRAGLKAKGANDALQGLKRLRQTTYDVVLLDINLPGMSGLTLYEHLREIPEHRQTPVIFMTSHAEFEARARSLLQAGDDFISKPILPVELTVKVTALVLKRRLPDQTSITHPSGD